MTLAAIVFALAPAFGLQTPGDVDPRAAFFEIPPLKQLAEGGMRDVIARYRTDSATVERFFDARFSATRYARRRELLSAWLGALEVIPFEELAHAQKIDYLLFAGHLRYELRRLDLDLERREAVLALLPFGDPICALHEQRRQLAPLDPAAVADQLVALASELDERKQRIVAAQASADEATVGADSEVIDAIPVERGLAKRAAAEVAGLRGVLDRWYRYSAEYDPIFTWWVEAPYRELSDALDEYRTYLSESIAGLEKDDRETILGEPIGAEALIVELENEWIPYTPDELIAIAESEFAWCDEQMASAAAALGFDDNWQAAQESVKANHVAPGEQPAMIRELALEAVDFLEARELLTIPPLAKNSWRMEMMSPERQKYTPYFTGGEVISVSYPTAGMPHEEKRMSMRGNNRHFSRATVHHELIPGHHLQQFMNSRYQTHRRPFGTPFWGEGWALYWEMLLWDLDFPQSPEDRIGMLFWRKHRCARILFSLNFHLGNWTPDQCIDFLVERVGHERRNATAEVRRSVQGGYGPLYQAAYMLGGLQFRALHRDLVESGQRTDRDFHDAILRGNSMPVELVRAMLLQAPLERDTRTSWRFFD